MSNINQLIYKPFETEIEFTFYFVDLNSPVYNNHIEIQQYPHYISLIDDMEFFIELNSVLSLFNKKYATIGPINIHIDDSKGRTFEICLNKSRSTANLDS